MVSFLRPFSNFENDFKKETEILVEMNFRSFGVFLFLFCNFIVQNCYFWLCYLQTFEYLLLLIIQHLSLAAQSSWHLNHQRQPQHSESMLSTVLGLPKDKSVGDHYSCLAQETLGFSQGLLSPWTNSEITTQLPKLIFISV